MSHLLPLSSIGLREAFPALQSSCYFNYGGQGPMPASVLKALIAAYQRTAELGPFSKAAQQWIMEEDALLRQTIADLLATTSDRIALTDSTIAGLNIPLWGLDWNPGDRLLLSDAEHYAVWEIATLLRDRLGVELDTCVLSQSADPASAFAEALTPKTRMACISHILWNSGRILPLKALANICQRHNVLLAIDGAQSVGVLPLDLPDLGVDFYAFTGHKWLCGPAGVGGLYISQRGQAHISPTYSGWCRTYSRGGAEQFEISTAPYPLRVALRSAINWHNQWGSASERFSHQQHMASTLWKSLSERSDVTCLLATPPESGLVPFVINGTDSTAIELQLEAQRVYVRSMENPAILRASVHYCTSDQEIHGLLTQLGEHNASPQLSKS